MCRFRLRMRNFTGAWKGHENAADENESCNAENRTGTRENSPTPFRRGTRVPSRSSSMPGGFNIPPCKTCNVDLTGSESFEPLPMGYGNGSRASTNPLTGRRDDAPAGPPRADACNAHYGQICTRIGRRYMYHCCNCLKRMGALSDAEYNSSLCCTSCRARWPSLPDQGPLPSPSLFQIHPAKLMNLCAGCEIM